MKHFVLQDVKVARHAITEILFCKVLTINLSRASENLETVEKLVHMWYVVHIIPDNTKLKEIKRSLEGHKPIYIL